ncbi:hypothetical protein GQ42DRAFT_154957 [Ramicandelaber brevisporus]|nr:hypothetical protein GQ42DRAFT_154957 [Ramicandelaber brevisporus]
MNTINNDGNEAEKEKEEEEDYDDDDDDFMVVETNRSPAINSNSRKRPHPIATPVTINEVNGDGNGDEDDDDDDFAVVSTNFNEKEVQEQERERKRRQAEKDGLDDIMNYAAVTVLPLSGIASTKCVVCLDVPTPAVCTPCGHIFCETCILNSVSQLGNCPVCRKKLSNSKGLRVLQFSTAPGRIVTLPSAVS